MSRRIHARELKPDPGNLAIVARMLAAALVAEREAIQQALDHFRWNRRKAAQMLGVTRQTLAKELKHFVSEGALALGYGHIDFLDMALLQREAALA